MSGPRDSDNGRADTAYEACLDACGWVPDGRDSPFDGDGTAEVSRRSGDRWTYDAALVDAVEHLGAEPPDGGTT